jgi:hypothetical protein
MAFGSGHQKIFFAFIRPPWLAENRLRKKGTKFIGWNFVCFFGENFLDF